MVSLVMQRMPQKTALITSCSQAVALAVKSGKAKNKSNAQVPVSKFLNSSRVTATVYGLAINKNVK